MKKGYFLLIISFLLFGLHAQKKPINITTELNRLGNIADLPRYLDETKVLQVSSYDTTGGNDDGFSGKYSFIRRNPDSTLVIFDAIGQGVINRIWTPTPTEDIWDFYFGGSDKPQFSIPFLNLFSGEEFPFVAPLSGNEIGGYYCYFPIPFKNGCKIVSRGKKLQFYQIQYRTYPKKYDVENFSGEMASAAGPELEKLNQNWDNVSDPDDIKTVHTEKKLVPGQTLTLAEFAEGGRILGFELHNAEAFEGLNKQIDIRISWDDENSPAIYLPIADLFGYAFGNVSMKSLLLGTKDNTNYCYFPMPFDKKAKIELIYRSSDSLEKNDTIPINADFYFSEKKRIPDSEGKFYAFWNRNSDAPLGKPHLFLEGMGKGHYVGTILQAQGLDPGMTIFFEGDDITTIDGEMRVHGTGSEDYFNGGWYALLDRWDKKISLPLHGALDYSLPFSRTGGYRLFLSDKMTFEKEIHHTIEHGPEQNNALADYTSVAFYYADNPVGQQHEANIEQQPPIFTPSTFMIYPQLTKYSFSGKVEINGNILRSGMGAHVQIDLSEIPKGHYKLYADIEKFPEGAEISIWQRQAQASGPISFRAGNKISKPKEYLCDISIDDFKETITLRFKKDPTKNTIRIDRFILVSK